MGSGISDGELPTEYEKTCHKETYSGSKEYEIVVGGIYRELPDRKDICSVIFASPTRLCVKYADGYRTGNSITAEGLSDILELAEKLDPVSLEWALDTARMFRERANWLEMTVRALKASGNK